MSHQDEAWEPAQDRSDQYEAFLSRLLTANPAIRFSAEEALKDPWLCPSGLDETTWSYLLERELQSYSLTNAARVPVFPREYPDAGSWEEQVALLVASFNSSKD